MTATAWFPAIQAQPFTVYYLATKEPDGRGNASERELRGTYYKDGAGKWRDTANHSPLLLLVTHVRRDNRCKKLDNTVRAAAIESAYRL